MYPVTFLDEAPRRLIGLRHVGPYARIGQSFGTLGSELVRQGLWPQVRSLVAVYDDDPLYVAPEALRAFIGAVVGPETPCLPPLHERRLTGGRHAAITVSGPYSGLPAAHDWLFGPWLAKSDEDLRGEPAFELYLNTPADTAPEDLRTLILLPVKERP